MNRLCSFSTKLCCVVGSRSFSTAMGGDVSCGREQRFRRSEQVAAAMRWSVLLPQSALRYTRQFWTMFHRAETMIPANMLMLGQRWPNVCSYVGSTSHANVGSTLFCSLGLRWPYRWRQPFANLQPMLIQRWPNVIQYDITLGQR